MCENNINEWLNKVLTHFETISLLWTFTLNRLPCDIKPMIQMYAKCPKKYKTVQQTIVS